MPGGGGLLFTSFDRPQPSPSGDRWIVLATNDSGNTANDRMYLTGQRDAGLLRIREGVTEIEPGRVAENMSDRRAGITDDGRFNDDAFYDVTGLTGASLNNKVDNFFLADDLWLYGVVDLRNGAGTAIGEAFIRIQVPTPGVVTLAAVAAAAASRRRRSR